MILYLPQGVFSKFVLQSKRARRVQNISSQEGSHVKGKRFFFRKGIMLKQKTLSNKKGRMMQQKVVFENIHEHTARQMPIRDNTTVEGDVLKCFRTRKECVLKEPL